MRITSAATFLLLAAAVAGCADESPAAKGPGCGAGSTRSNPMDEAVDFITPGVWNVCGDTDHVLVWVHNAGTTDLKGNWSVTAAANASLPAGWSVTFQTPSFTLKPSGTKVTTSRGVTYPDWAWTLATLKIPANTPAGSHAVVLHAGPLTREGTIDVVAEREKVSGPGSKVTAQYDGTFSDGSSFDDGEFPTTLGSGQTVPGFDYGLMGLALHEKAKIFIPPAMGYGYDNPSGNYAKFNGQTLIFAVEIKALA